MILNLKGIERIKTSNNPKEAISKFVYNKYTKPELEPQTLGASIIHCPKKIESLKSLCNMFNLGRSEQ